MYLCSYCIVPPLTHKIAITKKEIQDIQEMKSVDTLISVLTRLYYYLNALRAIVIPRLREEIIGPNPLPALLAASETASSAGRLLPQWKIEQQQREEQKYLNGGIGGPQSSAHASNNASFLPESGYSQQTQGNHSPYRQQRQPVHNPVQYGMANNQYHR